MNALQGFSLTRSGFCAQFPVVSDLFPVPYGLNINDLPKNEDFPWKFDPIAILPLIHATHPRLPSPSLNNLKLFLVLFPICYFSGLIGKTPDLSGDLGFDSRLKFLIINNLHN